QMEIFRDRLIATKYPGVTSETSLDALRQRVILAIQWENAARIVNAAPPGSLPTGWISVPFKATSIGYPGEVWIGTKPFARPEAPFVAEYDVRFSGDSGAFAEFLLTDKDRTTYLTRFTINPETFSEMPQNTWVRVRVKYDPTARTTCHAIGADAEWSDPVPFEDVPVVGDESSLTAIVMADPRYSGLEVRRIAVQSETQPTETP
ncbi:MAG: hypothetical protein WEB60_00255, partial [Terrimicrobiaceae bacterium]